MGLTERLLGWARPRVLVVPVPGATSARLAAEAALAATGAAWADSPAGADLLVVAGEPHGELAEVVGRVWRELPGPRAQVRLPADADEPAAGNALAGALEEWRSPRQRDDALARRDEWGHGPSHGDMGGHAGHDMGGMAMPAGLMMADRAPDRDGLKLDVLHVPLGPVLPDWPAGLVIDTRLQGDVIQQARARVVGAPAKPHPFWTAPGLSPEQARARRVARRLDSLARLLAVVGWSGAADRARTLRARALSGHPDALLRPEIAALARRVRRSRTLRLATDGGHGTTGRWQAWLDELDRLLAGGDPAPAEQPDPTGLPSTLAGLLVGRELGTARVILAGFDPDTDLITGTEPQPTAGGGHEHGRGPA